MDGEENLRRFWASYAGDVTFLDDRIGRVINRLKEQGRYDDTMIVFTVDHGWIFGNHKWWGYGSPVLTDELARVPLIIKPPGRSDPRRISEVVSAVDVVPTLLDYAGVPYGSMDGRSLRGLIEGQPREDAYALCYQGNGCTDIFQGVYRPLSSRMLREGKWKYILYNESNNAELLDMESDPGECLNVAAQFPKVCSRMKARMVGLLQEQQDPFLDGLV
jgi:arylsulfatase A-like enzyme